MGKVAIICAFRMVRGVSVDLVPKGSSRSVVAAEAGNDASLFSKNAS